MVNNKPNVTKNCVDYFQDQLKTDTSLQGLRDAGILDVTQLDKLQSIEFETTSHATKIEM